MPELSIEERPHVNLLARLFQRISLRQRFLVAPLLGLLVCGMLTAAFIFQSDRQNTLLGRITDHDLARFNHFYAVFNKLTFQHSALYDLLYAAEKLDEPTLYDKSKEHLYKIQQAVDELDQTLSAPTRAMGSLTDELRAEILRRTKAYRAGAVAAVMMTTVDLKLAPAQLALANERFTAMNQSFVGFLDLVRQDLTSEISGRIHESKTDSATIAAIGISVAAMLFFLSLILARLLSGVLQAQIGVLTNLGVEAGAPLALAGPDEIGKITQAIAAFRRTLLDLRAARDGLEIRVLERTQELVEANGELRHEIELRKAAEKHLEIYAEVIRSTGESVIITDPQGKIIEVNPAYQRATGASREEVIGTTLHVGGRDPHSDEFYKDLWKDLTANGYWTGELMDRRRSGEPFHSWVLINALRDNEDKVAHYVCVSRDITALKQSEQQLQKLAFYDSLTGLPNRALFKDRLNVALASAERQKSRLAVMYLDLDRFKYVNDTLGHSAGDRLLVEVGQRIGACLRGSDTLARMGGDEFTILLTHLKSEDEAAQIADRIVKAVGKVVKLGDDEAYVGTSVGITFYPNDGRDAESLQMRADLAMYEAKQAGRGQYRTFKTEMLAQGNQRLSMSVEIEAALKKNEFTLFYQPIVNLVTGRPEGIEALIRWQKPDGRMLLPEAFLPHAQTAGLIKKIDCWVLARACREAAVWHRSEGYALPVCVNLSAISLQQPDMAEYIIGILKDTGLPPCLLNLEITEMALTVDPQAAYAVLENISSLGVMFSIGDFGTGSSSLGYLSQFPINCLKLDREFIDRIGKDKKSEEVIRSLLRLANKLNIRVVAEGVEQQKQQAFLTNAGCELMQGYHFVEPMHRNQLIQWLSKIEDALISTQSETAA